MMPFLCAPQKEEEEVVEEKKEVVVVVVKEQEGSAQDSGPGLPVDLNHEDYYFPSVDLLTAQVHARRCRASRHTQNSASAPEELISGHTACLLLF